jgi:hypothetical protein
MNMRKLGCRFGAVLCGAVMLTACEGENLFDNSKNPFIEPQVEVLAPDVADGGDTILVNVSASAALNVQRMLVSMRGAVSKDTLIITGAVRTASANIKVFVPFVVTSNEIIINAQVADVSGRVSRLLSDTILVVAHTGPVNGPTILGINAPDTTRAGRVVDVRVQAQGSLPINQLQFRFRGAVNQTITVPISNQITAIADAQVTIPDALLDNTLTVSVVARDVNNQFSLLTGVAEKSIQVFPKITSP